MSDVSKDWLEAERRIEEARASGVEKLDLSGLDIEMVPASVAGLEQVNWFQFLPHRRVVDVTALKQLPALQKVNLWLCNELCDLSPLTTLANLQHLGLYDCQANLSPLASLATLQHLKLFRCHSLTNISLLTSFKNLKLLDLSWNYKLTDLSPLASQANLRQLVLDGCNNLSDLAPILKLPKLKALYLIDAIPLSCQPGSSILEGAKELEMLSCNSLLIAPNELASQPEFFNPDNCLPRLKAWRADLDQGQADNHRIKLFVLGNGSAGKTQICRRLNDQAFDPNIPSTHGIDLGKITLISANEDKPEIVAHVWDFGGQDIYHGTHALFMDERALFVIVWNPELETAQPYTEHGVAMRHRPLAYWLAMVRDVAGEDAAVVVVQSKCDRQQDSVQPPLPAEHGLRYLRYTACSAKNQLGMSSLLTSIQDQAQLLLERYGQVLLPASWAAVGDTLRARCSEGLRTLPRAEFETLCRAHHASAPPEVVLHYLHRSGEVFYRPGLFGDQLILNQQWALKGVYAVLDRQCSLPLLRRLEGKFDQEILDELVWRGKYSSNEQALFISLMEQCGACFPVKYDWNPKQRSYLAPDLLPERHEVQGQIDCVWRGAETHLEVWLNYRFLHDGVMKALLCAIGRRAGVHAVYWRYGVCFFDQGMQATFLLEAQPDIDPQRPGAGRLVWQAHVVQENKMAEVQRWLNDLLKTVERNTQGQRPEVSWQRSQAHTPAQDRKASHHDDPIQRLQPGSQPDTKPTVYVSYSRSEANTMFLAQLKAAFTQRGCQLIYDEDEKEGIQTGSSILAFEREIGRSRHVLVLLDEKYLHSWHCMNELLHIYDHCLQEMLEFLQRIVPCVLQPLLIDDGLVRDQYHQYWVTRWNKYQDLLQPPQDLSVKRDFTVDEARTTKRIYENIDPLLGGISTTKMPRGAQALSADNFAAIFTALHNQGFPLPAATEPGQ